MRDYLDYMGVTSNKDEPILQLEYSTDQTSYVRTCTIDLENEYYLETDDTIEFGDILL